ncbi:hypothetical protein TYRP_003544, partial [Tyrophagus putrescentiae]
TSSSSWNSPPLGLIRWPPLPPLEVGDSRPYLGADLANWRPDGLLPLSGASDRYCTVLALRKLEASSARRKHQFGTGHSGRSAAAAPSTADHIIPPQHTN